MLFQTERKNDEKDTCDIAGCGDADRGSGLTFFGGCSAYARAKALGTPAVPEDVAVTPTAEGELTVTWTAVRHATQYNVYRYRGSDGKYYCVGTVYASDEEPTQYKDTELAVGTTYYYKVEAVALVGQTEVSSLSVYARAKALGTPAVPEDVTVTPTAEGELTVTWTAVRHATQYNVYRYRGSDGKYHYIGTAYASAANPTQYVDTGLNVGTTYYYRVVAVCKGSGLTFVSARSAYAKAQAQ